MVDSSETGDETGAGLMAGGADALDPVTEQDYRQRLDAVYDAVTDPDLDAGRMEDVREQYADGPVHQMTQPEVRGHVREMMADAYAEDDPLEIEAYKRAASTMLAHIGQYPTTDQLEERRDPAEDIEAYLRETDVPTSTPVEEPERLYRGLQGSLRGEYEEPESMLDDIVHLRVAGELPEEETTIGRLTSLVGL